MIDRTVIKRKYECAAMIPLGSLFGQFFSFRSEYTGRMIQAQLIIWNFFHWEFFDELFVNNAFSLTEIKLIEFIKSTTLWRIIKEIVFKSNRMTIINSKNKWVWNTLNSF